MARIAAHLVFWPLMLMICIGCAVGVVVLYFPFVVIKALFLVATGRLHETTGRPKQQHPNHLPSP